MYGRWHCTDVIILFPYCGTDFLDLVSNGPVEWKSEIEEGIIDAAKFVAFIDKDYILSYNCLMELSVAMSNNKPILLVLLDNEVALGLVLLVRVVNPWTGLWHTLPGIVMSHQPAGAPPCWLPSLVMANLCTEGFVNSVVWPVAIGLEPPGEPQGCRDGME